MRRATTAAEVQRCIDELAREGLEDAGLVAEAARLLEARQLVEVKRRRREAAAARAQKDLDEFIGMSGLECGGCGKRKLHREFLQRPLTERCDHLQQRCMRCVKSCLDNRMVCPEAGCRAAVTEEELLSVDNMLWGLFPEDLTGGGVDMFRVTTSFLERSGSGRDNVQIRQLTGESITLQCSCADDTVAEFKALIEEQIGTPAGRLRLVCRGTQLADPMANLQDYGVENGSVVNMMVLTLTEQRVDAAGGRTADESTVCFCLSWDDSVDLDLHCQLPTDKVCYFSSKDPETYVSLDVDKVASDLGSQVENIFLRAADAPDGDYDYFVRYFSGDSSPVHFTVVCNQFCRSIQEGKARATKGKGPQATLLASQDVHCLTLTLKNGKVTQTQFHIPMHFV
jgi:hypothetical protein